MRENHCFDTDLNTSSDFTGRHIKIRVNRSMLPITLSIKEEEDVSADDDEDDDEDDGGDDNDKFSIAGMKSLEPIIPDDDDDDEETVEILIFRLKNPSSSTFFSCEIIIGKCF